jgi:hypothetical protein
MTEQIIRAILRPYPRCYVYIHFDPRKVRPGDKEQIDHVVYVGEGTRERAWVDERTDSNGHSLWLRDLQYQGFSPDQYVSVKYRTRTKEQAVKLEKQLLQVYRKKGILLFNNERGYTGPVRTYENKFMPDAAFGSLIPPKRPEVEIESAMTEERFTSKVKRMENEAETKLDLRPFEDQQDDAAAWYLGRLVFLFSVNRTNQPRKPVALEVDDRFKPTQQLDDLLDKLTEIGLPIEIRSVPVSN